MGVARLAAATERYRAANDYPLLNVTLNLLAHSLARVGRDNSEGAIGEEPLGPSNQWV
jgi:hypothetical protein